jgi:hypothetical protein
MNTPITPWINLTLHEAQRYHHLAWFLYGWIEREQLLNLDALVAWWLRGAMASGSRSPSCRRDGLSMAPLHPSDPFGEDECRHRLSFTSGG